ncbi:MAG: ABC transporter ATP-binding protein [Anaerosomatales bacterium]|nr:ABC transporter ATP-binding protein [Anaerosomatales bacterium]MDT8433865.1 ABC transporter ATP-binding protein [Anaerosomatales bacterium]
MAGVHFEHVTKRFGDFTALKEFDLEIHDREFLVLVGPSGCGKSTALRMLAGLEDITEGSIYIGDRRVNGIPAKDRDIAMVFQSYALYPHMTVFDNIAFGLRLRKTPKDELTTKVKEAATTLGVDTLLDRKPGQLSGGQRQRVAVARAIVREPQVFLLDEPLSNLDAKLRVHTRAEISKLHQRLGTTFVYVTHDQTEAMTMADRIAVMNEGIIQQVGSPQELYDEPVNVFVAGFIGSPSMNFFSAKTVENGEGVRLEGDGFAVDVPQDRAEEMRAFLDREMIFGVRPENIHDKHFVPSGITAAPTTVTVDVTEPMGNEVFLHLLAGKTMLLARVDPRTTVSADEEVEVVIDMERMHVFDPESREAVRTA